MSQAFDRVNTGGSERMEASIFNIQVGSGHTEALQLDAYKGLGHPSETGNLAKSGEQGMGILAGMDSAVNSIPSEIHGAQREMIGGDARKSLFGDMDGDGKLDVKEFQEAEAIKDRNHAGMSMMAMGFSDGGFMKSDAIKKMAGDIAEEKLIKNV